MRRVGLMSVVLVSAFWLAFNRSQRFDFIEHDQFVAGSSQIMALNARLDALVLQQRRDPQASLSEQAARLEALEVAVATLTLPHYLPPEAAADLEPLWLRLQNLVSEKRQLLDVWTQANQAFFQQLAATDLASLDSESLALLLLPPPAASDSSTPNSDLIVAFRAREDALNHVLASDLAHLSQSLFERYVIYCQAVLARDREWAILLFSAFMLAATGLSFYTVRWIRRADGAIKAAEARYRNLFLNAAEGIFQSSPEGKFLDVNPALAKILKFDSPQALMQAYDALETQLYVEPGRREHLRSLLAQYSVVNHFESQVFCKDGAIIWISESVRATFGSQGQLLHYEGTISNITARKQAEETLKSEQERSEKLLLNILPQTVVDKLKTHFSIIAESYSEATILFADIVNFTDLASQIDPAELVQLLNEIFTLFDALADSLGLEKIKTIGDAYMVVGGVPEPRSDHALAVVEMAIAMQAQISQILQPNGQPFSLRIGINSGSVVAGVIGTKKFIYDLWGDAVNIASRMESQGVGGEIQITETTARHVQVHYELESRGEVNVKGKGMMSTYWVGKRRQDLALAAETVDDVPLLTVDTVAYCGVQRPGFPIAIGILYRDQPYYRFEFLPLSLPLAQRYAQLKATSDTQATYVLLPSRQGFSLYRHQSDLKHFSYAAALASISGQMRNQIDCSDRMWRLRVFYRCFEGTTAVNWLSTYLDCDRDEAIRIGQDCLDAKLIHHVLDEQPFADAGYYYRFWQDGKPEKRLLSRLNT